MWILTNSQIPLDNDTILHSFRFSSYIPHWGVHTCPNGHPFVFWIFITKYYISVHKLKSLRASFNVAILFKWNYAHFKHSGAMSHIRRNWKCIAPRSISTVIHAAQNLKIQFCVHVLHFSLYLYLVLFPSVFFCVIVDAIIAPAVRTSKFIFVEITNSRLVFSIAISKRSWHFNNPANNHRFLISIHISRLYCCLLHLCTLHSRSHRFLLFQISLYGCQNGNHPLSRPHTEKMGFGKLYILFVLDILYLTHTFSESDNFFPGNWQLSGFSWSL